MINNFIYHEYFSKQKIFHDNPRGLTNKLKINGSTHDEAIFKSFFLMILCVKFI